MSLGDPGEQLYAQACGDGKKCLVYLNGKIEKNAVTADETLGMIRRAVTSENGNIAFNRTTSEILMEDVYGDVRIVIV